MGKFTERARGILETKILTRDKDLRAQHSGVSDERMRELVNDDLVIKSLLARSRKLIERNHRGGYPSE